MASTEEVFVDRTDEDQRPRQQTLGGVLRREGNWKCLLLTMMIGGCLAAVTWCTLAEVERVVINFSVYPIKSTRQQSPCEAGYAYIPIAFVALLYLVYLVECYHCTARIQLARRIDVAAVTQRVQTMRDAAPRVWWKAVCYHYVRRKRQVTRYRNGDAYTTTQVYYERVNTHSASTTFAHACCGHRDASRNLILDSKPPITKVRFSKGFAFANVEAASEFEDQRSRFFAEHERYDDFMEMREGLDLVGVSSFKEYMVAYRDADNVPWYSSQLFFWMLSCFLLSWPLRIVIECNTAYVHYTVTKIFGTDYELNANRQMDLSDLSPPVSISNRTQTPIMTTQMAIMTNYNGSTASNSQSDSNQQINILAIAARNRNPIDATISHTTTIESLELFAAIRENCTMVPSYSEVMRLDAVANEARQTVEAARERNTVESDSDCDEGAHQTLINETPSRVRFKNAESDLPRSANKNKPIDKGCVLIKTNDSILRNKDNFSLTNSAEIRSNSENDAYDTRPIIVNAAPSFTSIQCSQNQSAIIESSSKKNYLHVLEEDGACSSSANSIINNVETDNTYNGRNKMTTTRSNHCFRQNSNENNFRIDEMNKAQNRRSWAGFKSNPLLMTAVIYNSSTDGQYHSLSNDEGNQRNDTEYSFLDNRLTLDISRPQIDCIDRNLDHDSSLTMSPTNSSNLTLYFANPLIAVHPNDPFGGRDQTTPTDDPPPYEEALTLPILRRITRSITDRGDLFEQSRAFIADTIMNRRSCMDNIVSDADAVRLIQLPSMEKNEETNV